MLPIKMYEAMAFARPILFAVDGEGRPLGGQEAGAALHGEPGNAAALVSGIRYLREHPDLAETFGRRGRALVEERFDYDQLTATLAARIDLLLNEEKAAVAAPVSPLSREVAT